MIEEWKQYRDENYWVSNLGRIRSEKQVLKPYPNTSQYLQVRIYGKAETRKEFVSNMVAECWVPNPNGYRFVHHKDENPLNNRADNLEWVESQTHSDKRSPLRKSLNRKRRAKDIAQIDPDTGDIIHIWSRRKLMQSKEFHFPYILRCCNSITPGNHHGYKWRYCERNHQTQLDL